MLLHLSQLCQQCTQLGVRYRWLQHRIRNLHKQARSNRKHHWQCLSCARQNGHSRCVHSAIEPAARSSGTASQMHKLMESAPGS